MSRPETQRQRSEERLVGLGGRKKKGKLIVSPGRGAVEDNAMAKVQVLNVAVLDNPSPFGNPFQFEITFECMEDLPEGGYCFERMCVCIVLAVEYQLPFCAHSSCLVTYTSQVDELRRD